MSANSTNPAPFKLVATVTGSRNTIVVNSETVACCIECAAIVGWPTSYDYHMTWHRRLDDQLRALGLERAHD